ncbi:hypothetical protein ACS0TY_013352 [Phlomoides rotata]
MQYQDMSDIIGAESCNVDFSPDAPVATLSDGGVGTKAPRWRRRNNATAKEYPPVLPSLTPTCIKYTTEDGRVVIKEEKLGRRREYLQAHRSDGRLLLNLVPLDSDDEENVAEVANTATEKVKYDGSGGNPCGGFAAAVTAAVAELRTPVLTGETF